MNKHNRCIMLPDSFSAVPGRAVVWNLEAGLGFAPPIADRVKRAPPIADPEVAHAQAIDEQRFAELRRDFVTRTLPAIDWAQTVDVTWGDRAFAALTGCKVFELNNQSARELHARGAFHNLPSQKIDFACFWDVLDRFIEPSEFLRNVRKVAFLSLPLHLSIDSIAESSYFEHGRRLHYWTHAGFARYTESLGFEPIGSAYVTANLRPKGIVGMALRRVKSD